MRPWQQLRKSVYVDHDWAHTKRETEWRDKVDSPPKLSRGNIRTPYRVHIKGKVLPHLSPSVGPGADPGLQAVSPQVTWSHPPGGRLPLLSARPAVTFPAEKRHRPSAGTKLYCLVTEAHACEQLAQGCYLEADRPRFEPATFRIGSERSTVKPHRPHRVLIRLHNSHGIYLLVLVSFDRSYMISSSVATMPSFCIPSMRYYQLFP